MDEDNEKVYLKCNRTNFLYLITISHMIKYFIYYYYYHYFFTSILCSTGFLLDLFLSISLIIYGLRLLMLGGFCGHYCLGNDKIYKLDRY